MALIFRTAKTVCANVKVFAEATRPRPHLFLTAPSTQVEQCCPASHTQQFRSLQPPKKPAGAFLKFMNQKSPQIISKNPDVSHRERCKIAGQLWRDLDDQEKNRLKVSAREELQVYRQQYLTYLDQLSSQERAQLLQDKRDRRMMRALHRHKMELKRLGRPKRPPNSFNLFVKASRSQLSDADPPNFLKGLVESWRQMSEEDKAIYKANAKLRKEKYEAEMATWEQKMTDMGRHDLVRCKSQGKLASSSSMVVADKKRVKPLPSKSKANVHPKTEDGVGKRLEPEK